MSNNPYASPRQPDDRWDGSSRNTVKRPLSVTILGIFYCAGGGLGIFAIAYGLQAALTADTSITARLWSILAAATFLVGLSLVAGIGLLLGQRWGWWAAAYLSVDTIVRQLFASAAAWRVIASSATQVPTETLAGAMVADFARILFSLLLLLFLFKNNVRDYLGMIDVPWWRDIGYLLVAWAVVYLATMVFPQFLGL